MSKKKGLKELLYLINGTAGSGKTRFVREKIKDIIYNTSFEPLFLVPDQFSFENERSMLMFLGAEDMKKVSVYSFPRLAVSKLESKVLKGKMFADDGVRMVYMSEALTQLSGELNIFSKIHHNVSGLQSFIDFNKELKNADISYSDVSTTLEDMEDSLLKRKLSEINLINEAYDALLSRSYFDDSECLKYFNEFAVNTEFFKNKVVFLDSFRAFSEQEINCIKIALETAEDVYITICTDGLNEADTPFAFMNDLQKKLIGVAKKCNVRVAPVIDLNADSPFADSINHIEKNIYRETENPLFVNDDSVRIFKCNDITDECNFVASEIKRLIRSGKYRCRDIAVVERSQDKYKRIMCDVLKRFGVPVFDDSRRPLFSETLFIFITSAIECVAENFKTESVMRYLKTGLTPLSFSEVARLEKYVLVWGINGKEWYEEFTRHPKGFGSAIDEKAKKEIFELDSLRRKIIQPLIKLKKATEGVSGQEQAKAVYMFLEETNVRDALYKLSCDLNEEGFPVEALGKEASFGALIEILDTIAEITKDKYYSIKRWFELFSILVFSKDIGEIPQGLDEVKIGNADRIRTENVKVVFLMGVNKNEFPRVSSVGGLLTDADRRILTEKNLEIRPPFEKMIVEERFIAYCMLTMGKEKLYLSYREVSDDETTSGASELIYEIKELLPEVSEISSEKSDLLYKIESEFSAFFTLASIYNQNTELRNTLFEYFKNKPEYFDRLKSIELAQKGTKGEFSSSSVSEQLFGKDIRLSASKLDEFYHCPFSFFCRYGLDLNVVQKAELQPTDNGLIIHAVLEQVLKKYGKNAFLTLSDDELKEFIQAFLNDYLKEKLGGEDDKSKRFLFLYNRLIDILMTVFFRLKQEFNNCDFEPIDFELEIGSEVVPAYSLPLENNSTVSLTGSIDRVDLMEKDGLKYIRIIDYKSGKKDFYLSNLFEGINLQMVIYMMAILKNGKNYYGDVIPAGVLYLPSKIGVSDYITTRNASDEHISAQKRVAGKLKGMILESPVVLNGMGAEKFPDYLPAKYLKDNKISGNTFSQKQFDVLSDLVDEKIVNMAESVKNGKFSIYPAKVGKSESCKYCKYRVICGFEDGENIKTVLNSKHNEALKILEDSNEASVD